MEPQQAEMAIKNPNIYTQNGGGNTSDTQNKNRPEVVLYYGRGGGIIGVILMFIISLFFASIVGVFDTVCGVIAFLIIFTLYLLVYPANRYWLTTNRIIKKGITGYYEKPLNKAIRWEAQQDMTDKIANIGKVNFIFADGTHMTWRGASNYSYLISILSALGEGDEDAIEKILRERVSQNAYYYP